MGWSAQVHRRLAMALVTAWSVWVYAQPSAPPHPPRPGPKTAEMAEVEINEEIATAGLGVPALLSEAQADWGALCWLCWSVGLDRVALPEVLAEPPLFAVAMKTIVTRCWRAQDRLKTGGLLARANSRVTARLPPRRFDRGPRARPSSARRS